MVRHLVIAVLAITLGACGKSKRAPWPTNDTPENQAILAKLEAYIDCIGDHSTRVFQLEDDYTARSGNVPAVQPINDPEPCIVAIATAKLMQPPLPTLEAAGDRFAHALATAFTLTSAGKATSELAAAFGEFDAAQGALADETRRINMSIRTSQLDAREKKEGRTLALLIDRMMFHAEELVRRSAIRWDYLDKLDLAGVTAELTAFEDIVVEMHTHALANPKETQNDVADYSVLTNAVRRFEISARQLTMRVGGHIAFSDAEKIMLAANNEEAVTGTPGAMIAAYNQLVSVYFR